MMHQTLSRADLAPIEARGAAVVVALVAVAFIALGWTGYLQSDDLFYARAAQRWLSEFPYVGDSHWSLRHAIVLPVAALFGLFGASEGALVAPIVGYTIALIAAVYVLVGRAGDRLAALMAALVLASTPIIAEGASMVFTDIVEATFVCLSFAIFFLASGRAGSWRWDVVAGAFAGLAFVTRETTIALLAFYAVAFLAGTGGRARYFVMAGGFFSVVLADALYLGLASGDPFYRLAISLKGVAGDNPEIAAFHTSEGGFDRHGLLDAAAWVQPILMMLANRSFGPLFWIAIPAAIMLWRATGLPEQARRLGRQATTLWAIWFVVLAYALYWLWDVPRYHIVGTVMAAIVIGLWLRYVVWPWRPLVASVLAIGLMGMQAGLMMLSNSNPLFGERALVALAAAAPGTVHTDPSSLEGALFLLETAGRAGRVSDAAPASGDLYVYNSKPYRRRAGVAGPLTPGAGWIALTTIEERPKALGAALDALGVTRLLPQGVADKLAPPPRRVVLYRLP